MKYFTLLALFAASCLHANQKVEIDADGTKKIHKADGTEVDIKPDGSKIIKRPDGTTVEVKPGK